MRNTRQAIFFAPLLLAVTMGSTDCEYFTDVVVPSSDSSPPIAYDAVWRGGDLETIRASGGSSGLTYHIKPGQTVIVVSSAIDPDGLRKLTTSPDGGWTCCDGNICSHAGGLSISHVETQAGTVGSTVSSGIWYGIAVDLPTCNSGYTLVSFGFTWRTEGENFHGGKVTSATNAIVYP